ncbi:hypothetical protein RRF57_007668 [Xylaria bambusicola]|uniref:Uncharacterized protein n=1 Tax=Xylaria bambusicola TaxID=326684 RepID=A0AAN7USD1_9PEZI
MVFGGKDGQGKEIKQIPMCLNCAVACGDGDENALLQRAMQRVDTADGGLSRARWYAITTHNTGSKSMGKGKSRSTSQIPRPRVTTTIPNRQNLLGGDSSMDMVSSPPPDIPHTPIISGLPGLNVAGAEDDDTLARLHYRRYRADPRFAKLECIVPIDAALYVSIFDPVGSPAFRPHPVKPLPQWIRLLPRTYEIRRKNDIGGDCREKNCPDQDMEDVVVMEEEECYPSPHSVLDVHFPPATTFRARSCVDHGVFEGPERPMDDLMSEHIGNEERVQMAYPDARPPLRFASLTPPLTPPPRAVTISPSPSPPPVPQPRKSYDREANESINSDLSEQLSQCQSEDNREDIEEEISGNHSRRCSSPQSVLVYTKINPGLTPLSPAKTPYKRPSIVSDEPLRQPSSRLASVGLRSAYARVPLRASISKGRETSITNADNTGINTDRNRPCRDSISLNPILYDNEKEKRKHKTVVWDKSVKGGETESECCGSEGSRDSCHEMLDLECEDQKHDSTQDINMEHDKDTASDCEAGITNDTKKKLIGKMQMQMQAKQARSGDALSAPEHRRHNRISFWICIGMGIALVRTGTNDPYKKTETAKEKDEEKGRERRKEKEVRFAHPSLAVPGRRRERAIGIEGIHVGIGGSESGRGKTCPTCGNTTME